MSLIEEALAETTLRFESVISSLVEPAPRLAYAIWLSSGTRLRPADRPCALWVLGFLQLGDDFGPTVFNGPRPTLPFVLSPPHSNHNHFDPLEAAGQRVNPRWITSRPLNRAYGNSVIVYAPAAYTPWG